VGDASDQTEIMVHEMLHNYAGLGDVDLANALHLTIPPGDQPEYLRASSAISSWLDNNCP